MKKIFFFFTLFLFIGNSWPLKPYVSKYGIGLNDNDFKYDNKEVNTISGSYNEFTYSDYPILYILNNGDNEGFISPYYKRHDMRLGGATNWSKSGAQQKQVRLQYFGLDHNSALCPSSNCVVDSYLEGSNLSKPFLGIACLTNDASNNSECLSQGYISAENFQKEEFDNNPGYYHTNTAGLFGYTRWANAFWSNELQNEIKNLSVDGKYTVSWVHCGANATKYTQELYESGIRCKDITGSDAKMAKATISLHKASQLTFNGTNGFEDIFVDTSGSPSLLPDSQNCKVDEVSSKPGVSCIMVSYNYNSNGVTNDNQYLYLYYNTKLISGFGYLSGNDIMWKVDDGNWIPIYQRNTPTSSPTSTYLIKNNVASKNGNGTISIFFPKSFLQKLINAKVNLLDYPELISFQMVNSGWIESGYYEFLPFTHFNILPKEHSISIHPVTSQENDELNYEGEGSGILGSSTPIDIQYKIISSYSNQYFLSNVSLSVDGQTTIINGKQYCAFTDINGTGATIAVPQYVKYQTSESNFDSIETNCKKDGIDLTPNYTDYDNKAHGSVYWEKFDWTADDSSESKGTYARTYIDLVFPMDDSISTATTDGTAFEGKLQSTGTLEVAATWNDVSTSQ